MGKTRSLRKTVRAPLIVDDATERRGRRLKRVRDPLFLLPECDRSSYYISRLTLTRNQMPDKPSESRKTIRNAL